VELLRLIHKQSFELSIYIYSTYHMKMTIIYENGENEYEPCDQKRVAEIKKDFFKCIT
jgi:lauroyl/myristoyl acyltransferase